jgi:hypothetical protein
MAAPCEMSAIDKLAGGKTRWRYHRQGYHVFRRLFPSDQIETLAATAQRLIPAYDGELRRQDGRFAPNSFYPGTRLVRNSLLHPHVSLAPPLESLRDRLRDLVTSDGLADRLRRLDGGKRYIVHQSLLFFAAQTTDLHLDSWSLDTAPLGGSHTVWIPLQDMDYRSGIPSIIPWRRDHVVSEKALRLQPTGTRDERYDHYHRALQRMLWETSPEAVTPILRMGDAVVWSSLTPHFTLPAQSFPAERLSLQVLIRPADAKWGDFLAQPYDRTSVRLQQVNDWFSVRVLT